MIDYELQIFNRVRAVVAPLCARNKFVSKKNVSITALPAASLYEMDNFTVRDRQSSTPRENFARVTYQLDVYASSKSDCRKVYAAADEAMIAMNFNRISGKYTDIPDNPDVTRYTARYEADIDSAGNVYRRA